VRPYQNAVYKYVVTTLVDAELNEALQFAEANLRPKRSKSAIVREAVYYFLAQKIPAAFEKPDAIIAAE
jgi:hypothetical protein